MTRFSLNFLLILLFVVIARPSSVERVEPVVSPQQITMPLEVSWQSMDTKAATYLDNYFTRQHRIRGFNGTVLVSKNGKVFKKAYGYKKLRGERTDTLSTSTAFQLASVSKPVTAIAVLQMVEQGYVHLEDTLSCLLPDFPYPNVTVHQLLTHRSGLPNYLYITDPLWADHSAPMHMQDAYCALLDAQPTRYYRPGSRYNYSNTNYFLLAYLVERLTPYTFPEWVQRNIFSPAGMKQSFVLDCGGFQTIPNVAIGSDVYRRSLPEYYLNSVYGDKSLFSSVEDLYRLDQALREGRLLTESMKTLAYKPYSRYNYLYRSYGYGWRVTKNEQDEKIAFHTGWWRGYKSYYIRNLEENSVIIILSNSLRGSTFGVLELMRLWDAPAMQDDKQPA